MNFAPPFWLFGTLMVAPIAWTSLQWATYSVEQGGEIKNAHVFRNQLFIIVGSLAAHSGAADRARAGDAEGHRRRRHPGRLLRVLVRGPARR